MTMPLCANYEQKDNAKRRARMSVFRLHHPHAQIKINKERKKQLRLITARHTYLSSISLLAHFLNWWRKKSIMPIATATGSLCLYVDDFGYHPCNRRMVLTHHSDVVVCCRHLHTNNTIILQNLQVLFFLHKYVNY